jgi:AbrB family looped-hinge helix DNA binding protein
VAEADPVKTVVSTKGQVILPKAIRDKRRWPPGTRLTVEDTPEGVLLKPEPLFPQASVDEVFGMLKYNGPPVSIEEMHEGVLREARRRFQNGEY